MNPGKGWERVTVPTSAAPGPPSSEHSHITCPWCGRCGYSLLFGRERERDDSLLRWDLVAGSDCVWLQQEGRRTKPSISHRERERERECNLTEGESSKSVACRGRARKSVPLCGRVGSKHWSLTGRKCGAIFQMLLEINKLEGHTGSEHGPSWTLAVIQFLSMHLAHVRSFFQSLSQQHTTRQWHLLNTKNSEGNGTGERNHRQCKKYK